MKAFDAFCIFEKYLERHKALFLQTLFFTCPNFWSRLMIDEITDFKRHFVIILQQNFGMSSSYREAKKSVTETRFLAGLKSSVANLMIKYYGISLTVWT